MSVAGKASSAFGLNAEKYCYDFAVMRFIIAIIADANVRTLRTMAYRPVNWETVSIVELRAVSAESGKNLDFSTGLQCCRGPQMDF